MKKILPLLLTIFTLALPSFAQQYATESGRHRFDAPLNVTCEAFLYALKSNNYQIKSTDTKACITAFRAQNIDFSTTIIPGGDNDAIMQITPMHPNRLIPINIYRKIFLLTDEKIKTPNKKSGGRYILTNF